MRGRVIKARDVLEIVSEAVHLWVTHCTASIGAKPGIGELDYGEVRVGTPAANYILPALLVDESQGTDEWMPIISKDAPDFDKHETESQLVPVEALESEVVSNSALCRIESAEEFLSDELRRVWNQYAAKMAAAQLRRSRARIGNTFRLASHIADARLKMTVIRAEAVSKLGNAVLPQKKRIKGLQTVSTRRTDLPAYGAFTFNGQYAFRAHVGRQALPPGVWLERYEARKIKRRKNPNMTRKDNRGPVKLPATKFNRPTRTIDLSDRHSTSIRLSEVAFSIDEVLNLAQLEADFSASLA